MQSILVLAKRSGEGMKQQAGFDIIFKDTWLKPPNQSKKMLGLLAIPRYG